MIYIFFLGIEVIRTSKGILLSQHKYAHDLLAKAGMLDCKPSDTPAAVKPPLDANSAVPFADLQLFRSLVGSLQYLTLTRPEISHAVNSVCQHMHSPSMANFSAVKRILRYIKGTLGHGLWFQRGSFVISAFSDSDWAGDSTDRRSTTGYCIFLGPNLVSWSAKKQTTVARSSTEAEYRALAHTATDLSWIQQLMGELQLPIFTPFTIWCDNMSAIALAHNPVFHARTKHIEVDYHFLRDKVLQKQLHIQHIGTHDQLVDLFTKPLSAARFLFLTSKLMVRSRPMSLQGGVKTVA